ncbi:MAG: FHA domain-containing protein [Clostridiales bacterium]|nr:FHA domain-containing protein [Clostridiales bacterium]
MEGLTIKTKVDRVSVTYKMDKAEQINRMEMDIIKKKEIPALLPVRFKKSFLGTYLNFLIQDMMSVDLFFKSGIDFGQFTDTVQQISDTVLSCEAHGIRSGNLELSPSLIFYDYAGKNVRMLYWPLITLKDYVDLQNFFRTLGDIYICSQRDESFLKQYQKLFTSRSRFVVSAFRESIVELNARWKELQGRDTSYGLRRSFGDADVSEPTVYMGGPMIYRVSGREDIILKKFPFTIGRSEEYSDYVLKNNHFVSRRHATLLCENGTVYIQDEGSSNGTFLDGEKIPEHVKTELRPESRFIIGKEEFIFLHSGR